MSLIAELKRRNVFRVGAAYAIVAWLLVEFTSVLLPAFAAPSAAARAPASGRPDANHHSRIALSSFPNRVPRTMCAQQSRSRSVP